MRFLGKAKYQLAIFLPLFFFASACGEFFVNNVAKMSAKASLAIERYDDPDLLGKALPNNLIMNEGYLGIAPDSIPLLVGTAKMYGLYAMGFVEDSDPEHAKKLYLRGKELGLRALQQNANFQQALGKGSLPEFEAAVKTLQIDDLDALYATMSNWMASISLSGGEPEAMMDAPKAEALMRRALELNENYSYGAIHAAFGAYYGALSKTMGGQPEKAKQHFEKAFQISHNKFLYFYVLYARTYLVQIQDKKDFEKTLNNVIAAPSAADPQMTMANELAKIKAKKLLDKVDEYFL